MASLMCTVDMKHKQSYGKMHETPHTPLYVPLEKKQFDTIEINTWPIWATPFTSYKSHYTLQDYYSGKHQFGSGNMPVFVGAKYQRGHGLDNILGGLFRSIILPFIERNAPMMADKAIKTGINLANDASWAVPFKQSVKRRLSKTLKEAVEEVKFQHVTRTSQNCTTGW